MFMVGLGSSDLPSRDLNWLGTWERRCLDIDWKYWGRSNFEEYLEIKVNFDLRWPLPITKQQKCLLYRLLFHQTSSKVYKPISNCITDLQHRPQTLSTRKCHQWHNTLDLKSSPPPSGRQPTIDTTKKLASQLSNARAPTLVNLKLWME